MKNIYVSFPQVGVVSSEAEFLEPIAENINTDLQAPKPFAMFFRDQVGAVRVLVEDVDDSDVTALAAAKGVAHVCRATAFKAVEIDSTGVRTELTDPVVP
jgi:hypothetical protein